MLSVQTSKLLWNGSIGSVNVFVVWKKVAPGLHHELAVAARLIQLDALADDVLSHAEPQSIRLVATPLPAAFLTLPDNSVRFWGAGKLGRLGCSKWLPSHSYESM